MYLNEERGSSAAVPQESHSGFTWVLGTSFLWLPFLAFMIRNGLTSGGWVTLLLLLYWVPAFTVFNGIVVGVMAVRRRTGVFGIRAAQVAVGVWWFLAAIPVVVPADVDDSQSHRNPLLDWMLSWLPVAPRSSSDEGLDIALGAAVIAGIWWVSTVALAARAKRPGGITPASR